MTMLLSHSMSRLRPSGFLQWKKTACLSEGGSSITGWSHEVFSTAVLFMVTAKAPDEEGRPDVVSTLPQYCSTRRDAIGEHMPCAI